MAKPYPNIRQVKPRAENIVKKSLTKNLDNIREDMSVLAYKNCKQQD